MSGRQLGSAILIAFALAVGARFALAQGFAGLGRDAEGYAAVVPGHALEFPRDLGPHPAFRIEWWYLTANLTDEAGQPLGLQWTLFRQAMQPPPERDGWENQQIWMGHAAVTTADTHAHAEAFARGGVGQAGAKAEPFQAWIDDWEFRAAEGEATTTPVRYQIAARGERFRYALTLTTGRPFVLHGERGFSVKSEHGQASYYFSQPFLEVDGTVTLDGRERRVKGWAWMDREWSSQPLGAGQTGWDWFSLHFETGEKAMLFRLRGDDGSAFLSGTWISADGAAEKIPPHAIELTPSGTANVAGRALPVRWTIRIRNRGLDVSLTPLNAASWMDTRFAYWEGPVLLAGTHPGRGYLELTGYGNR